MELRDLEYEDGRRKDQGGQQERSQGPNDKKRKQWATAKAVGSTVLVVRV